MTAAALTKQQIAAATALLSKRPAVIPGTRAIIDRTAQVAWFNEVTETMHKLGVDHARVNAFCDLAGVAD